MIRNTAHVALNARNLDAMLRFYVDTLGMERKFALTYGDLAVYHRSQVDLGRSPTAEETDRIRSLEGFRDVPWLIYLKIADHQFLELFHPLRELGAAPAVDASLGYQKIALEVGDAVAFHAALAAKGVALEPAVRPTPDHALAFNVSDPDGNRIEIVQYTERSPQVAGSQVLPRGTAPRYIAQTAFQVRDMAAALRFYCEALGLKRAITMKYDDLYRILAASADSAGTPDPRRVEMLARLEPRRAEPWIEFLQTGEHQFLELFYVSDDKAPLDRSAETYGFQHLCLETDDIRATRERVEWCGIVPDGTTSLGMDGSWQFWLKDPEGNPVEIMQYTANSRQLK